MTTATMVPNTFAIEPFCPTSTTWSRCLMRLEGAFRIFTIKNEDPYTTLAKTLGDFYEPAPLEIAENYKFHQRKQKEGESVQKFLAALQELCLHCKFGEYVKIALRNQLVFGLISKKIQARLLELPDLTLEKVTQVATTMEMSDKGTQQLQGETPEVNIVQAAKRITNRGGHTDKLSKHNNSFSRNTNVRKPNNKSNPVNIHKYANITCYRCGKNHLASKCTLDKNIKCNACGRAEHLHRVCFQRNRENNQLTEVLQLEHTQFREKLKTTLSVNDKRVKFEIDSGAAVLVMRDDLVT
ncbi:uncharacterized protein LOC117605235 [Osmia lignaria lignaria]|uniref:uncharacterized protein LOC117605235 n=1 Tax=Osmia lignaria lignaria TaxID=1437193 RepID=UPI00147936FB|nr:uncharacterized protein LOC117605235 [Osmia lignaria]